MFKYLDDYNQLPQALRDRLSQPAVVGAIQNLEFKYHQQLAGLIMRIMIKDISIGDLLPVLMDELKLAPDQARELALDLKHTVFFSVSDYVYGDRPASAYLEPAVMPMESQPSRTANDSITIPKSVTVTSAPSAATGDEEAAADEILKQSGILFGSRELNDRLKKIVVTGLKGIRSNTALKEALVKPIEAGGLNFDSDLADKLLARLDRPKGSAAKPSELDRIMNQAGLERDVAYDFSRLAKSGGIPDEPELTAPPVPAIAGELDAIFPMHPKNMAVPATLKLAETAPAIPTAKSSADISWPKTLPPAAPKSLPTPPPASFGSALSDSLAALPEHPAAALPVAAKSYDLSAPADPAGRYVDPAIRPAASLPKSESGKVIMDDVKSRPRIFTPIDELTFMTIKNFRQLSKDPQVAIDLIKRKVDAIVQDDFGKKVEAINAWKQSPVNRMYVRVLKDALSSGTPADKALAKYKKEDPDFLTDDEFQAIIRLNQDLSAYK